MSSMNIKLNARFKKNKYCDITGRLDQTFHWFTGFGNLKLKS